MNIKKRLTLQKYKIEIYSLWLIASLGMLQNEIFNYELLQKLNYVKFNAEKWKNNTCNVRLDILSSHISRLQFVHLNHFKSKLYCIFDTHFELKNEKTLSILCLQSKIYWNERADVKTCNSTHRSLYFTFD